MKLEINLKKLIEFNDYLILLLVAAVLAVSNYLFTLLPLKLDLTAKKNYSLSEVSKKTIKNLDDVVNITVYISAKLPNRMKSSADLLKDTLGEYASLSLGKIKVEYKDPADDPNLAQTAQAVGIPKLQFSNIEGEQLQVSQGYFGLTMTYANKSETIPVIDNTANLEYELSSRLAKLTRKNPLKIAFSAGHDEDSAAHNLSLVESVLRQQYETDKVNVSSQSGTLLSGENNLLLIAGPKKAFTKDEVYLLDQYLMSGKSILLLSSGVQLDERLTAVSLDLGLNDWLDKYGLALSSDLILDQSSEIAPFNTGSSSFFVPYPFWVRLLKTGINQDGPLSGLETAVMPWTSSIKTKNNLAKILLSSSTGSWQQTGTYNLDPTQDYDIKGKDLKSFPLAGLAEGKLSSAFKQEDIPFLYKDEKYIGQTETGKLLVIADSRFINDDFVKQYQGNGAMLLNIVDYLASDVNLSQIRIKGDGIHPMQQLAPDKKGLFKYGNIFGTSALVAIAAFYFLHNRKKGDTIYEA